MTKSDMLEFKGDVIECLPNAYFKIKLDGDLKCQLIATISGRMRKNNIRVLLGDKVTVEVSPYDISRGRIIFRHK